MYEVIFIQEIQLRDAQIIAEDSDQKYEEVVRKLRMVENDLERIDDRGDEFEGKCKVYSEELQGLNTKAKRLEEICSKNAEAEDHFESEIHRLTEEVKNAETRAEFAERTVDKLEKNIDYLEDQLYAEKCAYKEMSEKLDITLGDMIDI
jgi:chromosome segregation ATPase